MGNGRVSGPLASNVQNSAVEHKYGLHATNSEEVVTGSWVGADTCVGSVIWVGGLITTFVGEMVFCLTWVQALVRTITANVKIAIILVAYVLLFMDFPG